MRKAKQIFIRILDSCDKKSTKKWSNKMRISNLKIRYKTISMCMLKNRQNIEEDEKSPNILENLWVVATVPWEKKNIVQVGCVRCGTCRVENISEKFRNFCVWRSKGFLVCLDIPAASWIILIQTSSAVLKCSLGNMVEVFWTQSSPKNVLA